MSEVNDVEASTKLLEDVEKQRTKSEENTRMSENIRGGIGLKNFLLSTVIPNAQLTDLYPNHIRDELVAQSNTRLVDRHILHATFICCLIICMVLLCFIVNSVGIQSVQFTIPTCACCVFSMIVKLILSNRLEPLTIRDAVLPVVQGRSVGHAADSFAVYRHLHTI